ncbi:hypothetical protein CkaCkLH20_05245 [Colletotrichum karsti]|uniref:Uncharacterized protein n=1 Tax=Colletotrichum karsti TaxID=1095194 RepID=A0A9P6LLS8_9PEZI|nr:uncharacterized protein CkaCkLH20_05245 [Colletotrichum karsti]KAF9877545.1 hypothetical protein CkaCkLH20_05245 [Colletotrichum karsti]
MTFETRRWIPMSNSWYGLAASLRAQHQENLSRSNVNGRNQASPMADLDLIEEPESDTSPETDPNSLSQQLQGLQTQAEILKKQTTENTKLLKNYRSLVRAMDKTITEEVEEAVSKEMHKFQQLVTAELEKQLQAFDKRIQNIENAVSQELANREERKAWEARIEAFLAQRR